MNQTIGEVISTERQNNNMTQEEFASRLGVTPQAVSKWERGIGMPDISLLSGICQILKISADRLLGIQSDFLAENIIKEANDNYWSWNELGTYLVSDPLLVEFHPNLVPCFVEGLKTDFVNKTRHDLAWNMGILMPVVRIRDNTSFNENEFIIKSYDNILYRETVESIEENTFQYIIQKAGDVCRNNYASILNKQTVKIIIDSIKDYYPGVADGLVPEKISYLAVKERMQKIIQENGNFHDVIHILEDMEKELTNF